MFLHQELLGGGAWTARAKKKKESEDYFVFWEQNAKTGAPPCRGGITRLILN